MSADTREARFVIGHDDATDTAEQMQISVGRDIAGGLLDRIEAIELYICELIEVIGQYESQTPGRQEKLPAQTPIEFLKWDLLNLVEESRIDTVRLNAMLKSVARSSARRPGYLN